MSRMNSFCHSSSLNRLPAPVPLGTVSASMNLMTACARSLPFGVRLTGEESSKLRALLVVAVDAARDAAARRRRQSELGGIAHHVRRRLAGDVDQRVLGRAAVPGADHEAPDRLAAHAGQRLGSVAPLPISVAIGGERRAIPAP